MFMGYESQPPSVITHNKSAKMLYHGLIVIGTSAILLLLYNLIIVRWCASRQPSATTQSTSLRSSILAIKTFNNNQGISFMLPVFKYKKELGQSSNCSCNDQCAVCLSGFEDGEDLKLLPSCKHLFHMQCIDMWLYSHLDCPICRAVVQPSAPEQKGNEPHTATARHNLDNLNMV